MNQSIGKLPLGPYGAKFCCSGSSRSLSLSLSPPLIQIFIHCSSFSFFPNLPTPPTSAPVRLSSLQFQFRVPFFNFCFFLILFWYHIHIVLLDFISVLILLNFDVVSSVFFAILSINLNRTRVWTPRLSDDSVTREIFLSVIGDNSKINWD